MMQVRDDGGLDQGDSSSRDGKKKSYCEHILNTELIQLSGGLTMGCKRREGVKIDSGILGVSHCGEKWNCRLLRYRRPGEEQIRLMGGGYHELSFVHIKSVELGSLQLSQEIPIDYINS